MREGLRTMATCPSCQLPNPEGVGTCIWCGRHKFADVPGESVVLAAVESSAPPSESVIAPLTPAPSSATIVSPNAPVVDVKPLPSHVNVLLTPNPRPPAATRLREPSPSHLAALQQAIVTPAPTDTAVPKLHPKLIVIRGQRLNQEYPIYEGRNVIGRFADRPVDIDLISQEPEGQIWSSRQHAVITFDKNMVLLEDLNSLNGTWLNGAKLPAGVKRPLQPNDLIQIGTVQMKLVIL
jgi:hypothetical protein